MGDLEACRKIKTKKFTLVLPSIRVHEEFRGILSSRKRLQEKILLLDLDWLEGNSSRLRLQDYPGKWYIYRGVSP
jgi:hypothetical protein